MADSLKTCLEGQANHSKTGRSGIFMPECLSAETLRLFIDLQFYLAQVDDVLATWRDTGRGLPPHLRKLLKLDSFLAHR